MEVVRGSPPTPPVLKDETDPNKLYIIGKGIYERLGFILDIEKYFDFATL